MSDDPDGDRRGGGGSSYSWESNGSGYGRQISILEIGYRDLRAEVEKLDTNRRTDMDRIERSMQAGFDKLAIQISSNRDRNDSEIRSVRESLAEKDKRDYERNKPAWVAILSLCFGGLTVIAGFTGTAYFLTSQQTQVLVQPMRTDITGLQTLALAVDHRLAEVEVDNKRFAEALVTNAQVDAESRKDRDDTRQRLDRMSEQQNTNTTKVAALTERLCESETQFAADENSRASAEQYQQRWNGIFYNRIFGETMPALGPPLPGLAVGKPCSRS